MDANYSYLERVELRSMDITTEKPFGLTGPRFPKDPLTGKRASSVPPTTVPLGIRTALSQVGPMSTTELGLHLGVDKATICHYLRKLREAKMPYFISGWSMPDGPGRASPVWAFEDRGTNLKDARRPTQTKAEQKRKRYARNKILVSIQRHGTASKSLRLNNPFALTAKDLQYDVCNT